MSKPKRSYQMLDAVMATAVLLCFPGKPLAQDETPKFRFHSSIEPVTLDPAALSDSAGGFLFFNLYRSLFRLGGDLTPQPELAKSCSWKDKEPLKLFCQLKPQLKFSNGEKITSAHFVSAWRRLVNPKTGSRHAEVLLPLKNAKAIIQGLMPVENLGIRALTDDELEIELQYGDSDFLSRLALPVLSPLWQDPITNPSEFSSGVFSGPYLISEWKKKSRIQLKPNPFYFNQTIQRPEVEILIVEEDSTALQLYDLGKINFLRRLNVKEFQSRKKSPRFLFQPLLRFDYVGFGPSLAEHPHLRRALQLSLNYPELTKAYQTPGQVGCPSIPKKWSSPWPCARFDLKLAKRSLEKARKKSLPPLILMFSSSAGEDVTRGMEWMQNQWKKHLGLLVEIKPIENAQYWKQVQIDAPSMFRKGNNLERPSCLAALENFSSTSTENLLGLKDSRFDQIIEKLAQTLDPIKKIKLCGEGLQILVGDAHLIPLGELHFAMMTSPDFRGWRVSPFNQLDLTDLSTRPRAH